MYYRRITEDIKVALSTPPFAEPLFNLVKSNQEYLKKWLPWVDATKSASDIDAFIRVQLEKLSRTEALHHTIFYQDNIVGVVGFNLIDTENNIGHIGYWLDRQATGKGIMTQAVADIISLGLHEFSLQKIEIRCATTNTKSRAIPERLGCTLEGILRKAEKVSDTYFDMAVYGMLKQEYKKF